MLPLRRLLVSWRGPLALVGCLLLCPAQAAEQTLSGQVVHIVDGDTFDLRVDQRTVQRIRLAGCDTPEPGQPFSRNAKQHLGEVLARQRVIVAHCYKVDRDRRQVCRVPITTKDVCLWQIEAGLAWWFDRFASEQTPQEIDAYRAAHNNARASRIGLWVDPDPTPP